MSASVPLMMFAEEDVEGGGKSIEDDFAYRNNVHQASLHIRLAFLRKVYSLLFIQLAATVVIGFTFMFTPILSFYIHNNDWLLSLSLILSVVILIALHWKRREYPTNLILLAAFTLIQAYSVGVVVTYFEQFVVLQALVLTVVVVGGLTAYTLQSKRDFSSLGSFLFASLCVLIVGGFLTIFFGSTALELFLSVGGALLFSLFIIYDTQEMMKRLSPEEYILATINLYLDIINLFLHILRALEAARR
ncbi:protein lifeguard 4-like [Homalodisca vitripennis]|uniref:protein lifeguard 4-like n=1 Tax=Homalodisca vitripennis TaxID=197043 RepID=UPI001EEB02CE|nr:protein lifeguard 4-like [Homalodisca vitripennis]XP_046667553.1 protein lifeguard 4-like [Homalodisca vitripennis]